MTSVFLINICFVLKNFVNIKICLSFKMMPQMHPLYFNASCCMNLIKSCFKLCARQQVIIGVCNNIFLIFYLKFSSLPFITLSLMSQASKQNNGSYIAIRDVYNMVLLSFDHISYTNWSNRSVTTQIDDQHIREYQCHGFLIG